MRVKKGNTFTPVHIILETQEELDKIYAIFDFGPLMDVLELDADTVVLDLLEGRGATTSFKSGYFEKIENLFSKGKENV